jgi:hypothetical protein
VTHRTGTDGMSKQDEQDRIKDARAARLSQQLRANLQRRKAQARARREGDADERPEGIALAGGSEPEPGADAGK